MATKAIVQPYLFFGGRCEEALAFYGKAVGAEVLMVMRFNEAPDQPPPGMLPEGFENKVMHASFRIGESTLMASDGDGDKTPFSSFSLSITAPTQADAKRMFNALAEGGTVTMPLGETFWAPCFGMLTDRFGMGWMVGVAPQEG